MKSILTLSALATVLLFTQCKKESDNGYKITAESDDSLSTLHLFVNGEDKGVLPFISGGADDFGDSRALNFSLPEGSYKLTTKDQLGNYRNSTSITFADSIQKTDDSGYISYMQVNKQILMTFTPVN
jgi:hypothetical protein